MLSVVIELSNGVRMTGSLMLSDLEDESEFITLVRPDGKEIQLNKGAIVVVYPN